MVEQLYKLTLFTPSDDTYQTWIDTGYDSGFLILICSLLAITIFYYLVLGYTTTRYDKLRSWIFHLVLCAFLTFSISLTVIGFGTFETQSFLDIPWEVWRFSISNMLFGVILFFAPFSLIFKYISKYNRYVPF